MKILANKDQRSFVAAIGYMILVAGLIIFLTYVEIPESTKNIIIALIGVFAGKLPDALGKLIGDESEEIKEMRDFVKKLENDNEKLHAENLRMQQSYELIRTEFEEFRKGLLDKINFKS